MSPHIMGGIEPFPWVCNDPRVTCVDVRTTCNGIGHPGVQIVKRGRGER